MKGTRITLVAATLVAALVHLAVARTGLAQAAARDDQDVEAAASVLREALASRKEKSGN